MRNLALMCFLLFPILHAFSEDRIDKEELEKILMEYSSTANNYEASSVFYTKSLEFDENQEPFYQFTKSTILGSGNKISRPYILLLKEYLSNEPPFDVDAHKEINGEIFLIYPGEISLLDFQIILNDKTKQYFKLDENKILVREELDTSGECILNLNWPFHFNLAECKDEDKVNEKTQRLQNINLGEVYPKIKDWDVYGFFPVGEERFQFKYPFKLKDVLKL